MEGPDNPTFKQDIQMSVNPGDYGSVLKDNSTSITNMEQDLPRPTSHPPAQTEASYVLFFQVSCLHCQNVSIYRF